MGRSGKRVAVEEAEPSEPVEIRRVITPRPTAASLVMRPETHPWLKWPGCSNERKIELNNKLATLQDKTICPPRIMDWHVLGELGISDELDRMFVTRYVEDDRSNFDIPIWSRALNVREDSYREWCLEFYSSLKVDLIDEYYQLYTAEAISFRLGGKEHKVTLPQFGLLTGLFTREEEARHNSITDYLAESQWTSDKFAENIHQRWEELSGTREYTTRSKIKEVRSPILRVIHKLITYSFLHRSSQQDKVYTDDLWLLHLFSRRNPLHYANVPWVLACFMESKGMGRQRDSQMVCGHFITRIARNLGLATATNIRHCTVGIKWRMITKHDLATSGLIALSGNRLIEEEEVQQQQQQPLPPRSDGHSMRDEIFRIGREIDGQRRDLHGMGEYLGYHMDRYQPAWEAMAQQYQSSMAGSSSGWPPYNPPPMFPPPQQGEGGENEEFDD